MNKSIRLYKGQLRGKSIDALEKLFSLKSGEQLSVYAYRDKTGGIRIAEISIWDGNGGCSWLRSDPDHAALILGSEQFIMTYGAKRDSFIDLHADARWYLKHTLTS